MLGVIRSEGDAPLAPQAELAELPRLVAGVRSPGFDAELVDRLDGAVPGRAGAVRRLPHRAGGPHQRRAARRRDARPSSPSSGSATSSSLTVDDDGAGVRGSPEGSGILGMRERAALLGGSVEVGAVAARRHARDGAAPVGSDARDPGRARRRPAARARRLPRAARRRRTTSRWSARRRAARSCSRSCAASPVDVVLMDIRMPGGDGLWATEQIAADPALAGVHVVIVTTFELDEYVARAIRAGASGFLVKDTEPVDLIRAVRVVASGEALLSPGVTKRLLERMAVGLRDAPDDERARRAHRPGARGAAARRPGAHERRDRRAARASARSPRRRTCRASWRSCTPATGCTSSSSPTSRASSRRAGSSSPGRRPAPGGAAQVTPPGGFADAPASTSMESTVHSGAARSRDTSCSPPSRPPRSSPTPAHGRPVSDGSSSSSRIFWFLVIGLIIFLVTRGRRRAWATAAPRATVRRGPAARSAESTLAERFAKGDIDETEYRARLEVLRANRPNA